MTVDDSPADGSGEGLEESLAMDGRLLHPRGWATLGRYEHMYGVRKLLAGRKASRCE
jgi:hypothetical protein